MRHFSSTLSCLLVLAGTARSQEEVAPKFRLTVNQVIVPVVVTDAKGHRVTGLKANDFEILEDGAPQKILSPSVGGEIVTPATAPGVAAVSAPAATPAPATNFTPDT